MIQIYSNKFIYSIIIITLAKKWKLRVIKIGNLCPVQKVSFRAILLSQLYSLFIKISNYYIKICYTKKNLKKALTKLQY